MNRKQLTLQKIRCIANYQFGGGVAESLFPDNVTITYSKSTGRIRFVYLGDKLLATLRPSDGLFSLSLAGARRLVKVIKPPKLRAVIDSNVEYFIARGGNVFAKHIIEADPQIRPGDEVIVTNENDVVLAVGKALLNGREMLAFKRGVAVKVRRRKMEE